MNENETKKIKNRGADDRFDGIGKPNIEKPLKDWGKNQPTGHRKK